MTAEKILCFFFAGGKAKALEKSRETGVFQRRAVGKGGGGRDRKGTQEKEKDTNIWEKLIFSVKNIEKWKIITVEFCA